MIAAYRECKMPCIGRRQGIEPRNRATPGCRHAPNTRKATLETLVWRGGYRPGGVEDSWHARNHIARNPGGAALGLGESCKLRMGNPYGMCPGAGGRTAP